MNMWFPKGVAIISNTEGEEYDYFEFLYTLENLSANMFTGLLSLRLTESDETYYLLMKEGIIVTHYQVTGTEDVVLQLVAPAIFNIRTEGASVRMNYYALTQGIVDIMMLAFTFTDISRNYPVSSVSDFEHMMSQFYNKKITGFVKNLNSMSGFLLSQGTIYYDFWVDDLIDILCSPIAINELKREIQERGSVFFNVWGEEHSKAQERLMEEQNRFAKFKIMTIKPETAFLDSSVKVSPDILSEWKSEGLDIIGLRIFVSDRLQPIEIALSSNQLRRKNIDSQTILIPRHLLRKHGLSEGQVAAIEPIYKMG